jgi:hypothetical protein
VDVRAVGDNGEAIACPPQRGAAERQRRRRSVANRLPDARIAIERDVLVVQDRIRIGDGRRHQRARVVGRRGHDDLQPGRPVEPGLRILRVVRSRMTQPAPGHPHHHRHAAAPAVADLRRIVHELVETGRDEVVELDFADRPLSGQRRADADAEHRALGKRRVDDTLAELLEQRAQQQEGVAVAAADVLAVHEHARVAPERVADAEHHRVEEGTALRVEGWRRLDRSTFDRRGRGARREILLRVLGVLRG